jgi:hypothetical protein
MSEKTTTKKRPNTMTIEISTETYNKLLCMKRQLEGIVRHPVSFDKTLRIFFTTVPIDLALEEYSIKEHKPQSPKKPSMPDFEEPSQ